ncbi:unnamed protein product [Prorocentrum cordatum]|uniref:Alpha-L-fucosidase n=1 Tax=Prorocentrum cordatum TaxID=2364126 RepID=A0ABN9TII1_9DINO|nr:unnamed protein product [Polarella glacialis]|mmetsp:Transcript_56293/g.160289  ORF Transcript_56293/g.160289 Transcript_56293/m.160289 type:complete len:802 (-) Transcript_56293:117-2522(-)
MLDLSHLLAACLVALPGRSAALEVEFAPDLSSYRVAHAGFPLFVAEGGIAVFCDGAWHSQSQGSLQLVGQVPVFGTDGQLGDYTGSELTWRAGGTRLVTTAWTYKTGRDVAFQYAFPDGAAGTSTVELAGTDSSEVIVNFPAFTRVSLANTLSWEGSFVQGKLDQWSTGPRGGPTVFFNSSDPELRTVVVASALDNFKATSAGPGRTWNGTRAWVPGTPGTIVSLPKGWTQTFLLHLGASRGITAAIGEWGELLQAVHRTRKLQDVTLDKIGYQTDNGAYYVFCRGNCSDFLLKKTSELTKLGVPMGYLSFQGSGASSLSKSTGADRFEGGAPWCVNTWGVDGGLGGQYPLPLPSFHKALGLPLQLYAPYFCPSSEYFNATSQWTSVKSDASVCPGYDFQDVAPHQSRAFYDWFFAKGLTVGMVSFEPDFMNQNYNCVPAFTRSATNATIWQHGMADAALAKNLSIQWCYAAPTDVLASLKMPAVTNFRVSTDFCYGNSWDVGVSSLLVWAVAAAPSKDTLWTSDNGRFQVAGCPWTPDHENPGTELHVVLALMTTGPVGISDGIGFTNARLIMRTMRADGMLLKPSKPATSVDSSLARSPRSPPGVVYSTFSGSSKQEVMAHYFVSFMMKTNWTIAADDFYPPLRAGTTYVYRRFRDGARCTNGTAGALCVATLLGSGDVSKLALPIPKSDWSNTTGGTNYAPIVITVFPVCASGWALLGDLTKYVAVSTVRFQNVVCTAKGISAVVLGLPGEIVTVTFLKPHGESTVASESLELTLAIPSHGSASLDLPRGPSDVQVLV